MIKCRWLAWVSLFCCCASLGRAGTLAQFRTAFGDLEVELYDQQKPITVRNFKILVQSGAYQNTIFHRVVPGFVAQGGGFYAFNPSSTNFFGPPWANLGSVPNFGTITNEFAVGPKLSNTFGTLAMAKLGSDPNSATCQWFFNLGNNSTNLDNQNGGFTVFGHVIRDTGSTNYGGVLGLLNQFYYGYGLVNLANFYPNDSLATNLFQTLPLIYSGYYQPLYSDLWYVDVTLLWVQLTATPTQRLLSWNSVNAKTNLVEYTTAMPPVWKTLVATNGNGSRYTVADRAPTNSFRFYRVRVLY